MKKIILILLCCASTTVSADNTDHINYYAQLVFKNLSIFTGLKGDCVRLRFNQNQNDVDSKIEFDLYEEHNETCGGDPATMPRITSGFIEVDDAGKLLALSNYDWGCECYQVVKEFE